MQEFGRKALRYSFLSVAVVAMILVSLLSSPLPRADAAVASNFNPGNIISDALFYNARMTQSEIQAFLSSKGSWLAGYQEPTVTKPIGSYADGGNSTGWGICSQYDGSSGESAAAIIFKVQNACGVSAQALLVTLQKESSLVTSGTSSYLRSAMGYACPDTSACDSMYYGLFNQMYGAARSFQWYGNQAPGSYSSKKYAVGWWNVGYNPNSACGTRSIYVENRATAALYYYTPYTPNAAAMANLYGAGDACSSYGNRNFWRLYTDWFGSTQLVSGSQQFVAAAYYDVLGRRAESQSAIDYYANAISSGVWRGNVALGFFGSTEYLSAKITEAYTRALNRAPEPGAIDYWIGEIRRGRLNTDELFATFLYSSEMYFVRGGGTVPGYVQSLYQVVLGRTPNPDEVAYYVDRISAGDSLSSIALSFCNSPERYRFKVWEAYQSLLGRQPTEADFIYWVDFARVKGFVAMRVQIMSSPEYWNRASAWFLTDGSIRT